MQCLGPVIIHNDYAKHILCRTSQFLHHPWKNIKEYLAKENKGYQNSFW